MTNHKALTYLVNKPNPSGRLARWLLLMEEFDIDIVHHPGTLVEICDFVTNEFATSCDYLTFTTTVGYIYNYCLHLKPLATTL